jgi:predicted  nucleic acid-binding Zn-ribbon protein
LRDLNNLAPEIKDVADKAKQFGSSSSPAMKSLVDTVKTIQDEWEGLRDAANDREDQLETSLKHAQNFQAQLDKMGLWLQLTEDKMDGLTPDTTDQDSVAKKLKEAQALRGDVLKFSYDQELLNREGQSLMDAVESDKGLVKVRLEDLNQRWDNINEGKI